MVENTSRRQFIRQRSESDAELKHGPERALRAAKASLERDEICGSHKVVSETIESLK